MDKLTHMQLDKIEQQVEQLSQEWKEYNELQGIDTLKGFYEEEIQNPQGQLHHLVQDEVLRNFFQQLDKIEKEENNEEYTNKGF